MNYQNAAVCIEYHRQSSKRRKKSFLWGVKKLAVIVIPIIVLSVVFSIVLKSNSTNVTSTSNTVNLGRNGVEPNGVNIDNLMTVTLNSMFKDTKEHKEEVIMLYTDREVELIAKTVYGEALVTNSDIEMAAVVWCILNRVDSVEYPNTIEGVVTQRGQFHGYSEKHPVTKRIEVLVRDVLDRWYAEKNGETDCGRVLPKEYIYFEGDGRHNHYSTEWLSKEYWDWSLQNPYMEWENCGNDE